MQRPQFENRHLGCDPRQSLRSPLAFFFDFAVIKWALVGVLSSCCWFFALGASANELTSAPVIDAVKPGSVKPSPRQPAASKQVPDKALSVRQLRAVRERLLERDRELQTQMRSTLNQIARMSLSFDLDHGARAADARRRVDQPLDFIQSLDQDRIELDAQRRIVDQLIFALDTKWSGRDLKVFMEIQLMEMASVDLDSDLNDPRRGEWWRFLLQASIAMREIAEPNEDPVAFFESYMRFSRVLDPRNAIDFLLERAYVGERSLEAEASPTREHPEKGDDGQKRQGEKSGAALETPPG